MFFYILNGKKEGVRLELFPGTYTFGRSPDTDLVLDEDKFVSGIHAELIVDEDYNLTLTDKKSRNGTFLLGEQVKGSVTVKGGDIFRIGHTFIKCTDNDHLFSSVEQRTPECIVVVDIVGSSKIAQVMGDGMASKVKNALQQSLKLALKEYPCEYLKGTGDGFMIIFSKVMTAVNFAVKLLSDLNKGGTYKGFYIRIGMNYGETARLEDGDRRGTAVDMAFRIESVQPKDMHQTVVGIKKQDMPKIDRIFVSETVFQMIHSHGHIKSRVIGFFDLKGFPGRHRIFEILT